ncbi:MAG: alpha/beta hydrolase [Pseudomonadota bacterium]
MPLATGILSETALDHPASEHMPADRRDLEAPFDKTSQGVAYRAFGKGEPLVLTHGGAGNWQHWVCNVDVLAQHFRVLAIDQPCYGDSDAVPWETSEDDYLKLCHQAIDEMTEGADRIHLAGFSFGGYIAAEVAVRLGARAASLSMTGGAGYGRPNGRSFVLGSKKKLRETLGREPLPTELRAMHAENLGKLMLWDKSLIDEWTIEMQYRNVEQTRFDSRRLSWADGTPGCVGRLNCPVMIVYGAHDAACIPPIAERIARCRSVKPDLEAHILPDCGHWAMYEAPERVNDLMIEFHGRVQ